MNDAEAELCASGGAGAGDGGEATTGVDGVAKLAGVWRDLVGAGKEPVTRSDGMVVELPEIR